LFVEGELYKRIEDIHQRFGGQRQGGISTPSKHPYIFIFTGKSGEQHGYEDGWQDEGVFLYTGEGQVGDMQFLRGNAALRDHARDGKDILLFESLGKGKPVRFLGRFACQSWDDFRGLDSNNQERSAIRFHLVKLASNVEMQSDLDMQPQEDDDLDALRAKAKKASTPTQSKKWSSAPMAYRERSKAVRDYVLARAKGKCELTGREAPFLTRSGAPYLEVHHTRRLSDDGPDDPRYVAALCPSVHREIHYGKDGELLNEKLKERLKTIEP